MLALLGRLAAAAGDVNQARDWLGQAEAGASAWRDADQDNPFAVASWAGVHLAVLELKLWGGLPAPTNVAALEKEVREVGLAIEDLRNNYPETAAFSRLMATYALIYPRLLIDPGENSPAAQPEEILRICAGEALGRLDGPLPTLADHRLVIRLLALLRARSMRAGQAMEADAYGLDARQRVGSTFAIDPRRFHDLKAVYERESDPRQGLWR
jgi:hypothetical protein